MKNFSSKYFSISYHAVNLAHYTTKAVKTEAKFYPSLLAKHSDETTFTFGKNPKQLLIDHWDASDLK